MTNISRPRMAIARKIQVGMVALQARTAETPEERNRRLRNAVYVEIRGVIDAAVGERVVSTLRRVEGRSILLYIDSPGGSVDEAKKICEAMDRLTDNSCMVSAHAGKDCSSAALAVFMHADERTATRRTRFLAHRCAIPVGLPELKNAKQIQTMMQMLNDEDQMMIRDVEARLGRALPKFMRADLLAGKDVLIRPAKAVEIGLVHGLG